MNTGNGQRVKPNMKDVRNLVSKEEKSSTENHSMADGAAGGEDYEYFEKLPRRIVRESFENRSKNAAKPVFMRGESFERYSNDFARLGELRK